MWRILMMGQYRHRETKEFVRSLVQKPPQEHFQSLLQELRELGNTRLELPLAPPARSLADIFFNYSFAANLHHCWAGKADGLWQELEEEVRSLSDLLEP